MRFVSALVVTDMFEGAQEQFVDVFVCQGVVDELAGSPELDQVGIPEDPELVRDCRLTHAEGLL